MSVVNVYGGDGEGVGAGECGGAFASPSFISLQVPSRIGSTLK